MIERIEQIGVAIAFAWLAPLEQSAFGPNTHYTLASLHCALVEATNVVVPWDDFNAASRLADIKVVSEDRNKIVNVNDSSVASRLDSLPRLEYSKGSPVRVHPVALFETSRESFNRLFGSLAPVAVEPIQADRPKQSSKDKNGIARRVNGEFNCGLLSIDVIKLLGAKENFVTVQVRQRTLTPFKKIGTALVFELSELRVRVKRYRWPVATATGELPTAPEDMPFVTKYSTLFSN